MNKAIFTLSALLLSSALAAQNIVDKTDTLKALSLKGVTIKGERPQVTMKDGKFTVDMSAVRGKHIAANAHELIKELPLVDCTDDEALKLTGAQATKVMINGRPSNLTEEQITHYLKTLSADNVDKVELLYNPSASYHVKDAAVINIITKRFAGYSLSGQLATRYKNRYANMFGSDASLFLSSPSWKLDLMYSFDYNKYRFKSVINSHHTITDAQNPQNSKVYYIDIMNKPVNISHGDYVYAGLSHDFNDKSNLSFVYVGDITPYAKDTSKGRTSMFRDSRYVMHDVYHNHDLSMDYGSSFGLQTGAEYNYYSTTGNQLMDYSDDSAFVYRTRQRIDKYKVYADEMQDIGKGWNLSYGAMFNFVRNVNTQNMISFDSSVNAYKSRSVANESTTDVYAGFNKSFLGGKIVLDCSLSHEWYRINSDHENDFMPKLSASWKLADNHMLQLSYNAYKEYPSYWSRQDYSYHINEYAVRKGNPLLKPEKRSDLNLTYVLNKKYTFMAQYRRKSNFFITQSWQSPDALQLVYQDHNMDLSSNWVFSAVAPVKFGKVAVSNFTLTAYTQRHKDNDWYGESYDRKKLVAYLNNRTTFYLNPTKTLTADLEASYVSPSIQGTWNGGANGVLNAGMKWNFLKGNAILSVRCNDILQTQMPIIKTRWGTQWQNLKQNYYGRVFNVDFTYKFGGYSEHSHKEIDASRYGK